MSDQDNKRNDENKSVPYYYSYGPYKSVEQQAEGNEEPQSSNLPEPLDSAGQAEAAGQAIETVRSESAQANHPVQARSQTEWSFPVKKKRSSLKSTFAAFVAGALVVSSLMFAADRTNLFSGNDAAVQNGSNTTSNGVVAANGGSSDSGIRNAAMQEVV